MKIAKYHLATLGMVLLLVGSACQTAQRPNALLPAQATAPAVAPTPVSTPAPEMQAADPSQSQPEAKPDPVGELIGQVEKEYQAGQDEYLAGHLESAKQNFDNAFNLLLSSGIDVRTDDRLQTEFDRVTEGTSSLEVQALQQGDGFSEQKSEPAPIDEANEATYSVDPNIRAKAEAEIKATHSDLPLMMTDPVAGYINYFSTRGKGTLERALARSGQYREMIQRILQQEGVPQDLIYLAQAESGFHPLALSRAGARGIWQFMASRATAYRLERDWWVDERQDPEKATRAAAHHLKDLYAEFGDWYLAMAAYNSGPGTVQNAVKRTGYADFWELYKRNVLPKETRNYVPIILAVTIMAKNPEQYGLQDVIPEKPESFETVRIDYPVDLRLVAECVDSTAATLQELNPSLLRLTTPKDQQFELHLPAGTKDRYLQTIAEIPPDMRVWWRYHKVAPGDTLSTLARRYNTSRQAIAQANHLDGDSDLQLESNLIIPVAAGKHPFGEDVVSYSRRATAYKVHKGDTVETVADNFGVPASMVRRWNHLKGSSLSGRRVLYVHLPVSPSLREPNVAASKAKHGNKLRAENANKVVRHKVQRGETLYSIASNYNTTVAALKETNRNVAVLRPGMILLIGTPSR